MANSPLPTDPSDPTLYYDDSDNDGDSTAVDRVTQISTPSVHEIQADPPTSAEEGGQPHQDEVQPTNEIVTNLTYKRRKRGREGPDHCLNPTGIGAVSAAIASSKDRPDAPVFYPYAGTVFTSFEEAKDFYNLYSWEVGFGIRESRSKKNKNEYITRKDIVCCCEGNCDNPYVPSSRRGCRACIQLRRTPDHSWFVSAVHDQHNHPLSVACGEKRQWGSHSYIDPMTKEFIKRLRRNNVPLGRVCSIVTAASSNPEVAVRREAVKYVCAQIAKDDIKDDMEKTMRLLKNMREKDESLEVRFRTNAAGVLESMLWCTGKNIEDYKKYGDVLTFDTTYRTNLYNLPFGIFVGVNGHYQSIIYGGVLLRHERTEDFEWAFSNFTDIMGGKQPVTVLTDQCLGMAAAIKSTWKGTRHRWCRWHVLRPAKQKIGPAYSKQSTFKKKFNNLITHEVSAAEFEKQWEALLIEYKLSDNKFLIRAYRTRGMWAKPYFMDIFCARMTSTQRSESANHMLKRFIQRGAPMHIFVEKFSDLQFTMNQQEQRENFRTKQFTRSKRLGLAIESHSELIYTREMHERFNNELYEAGGYTIAQRSQNNNKFVVAHHTQVEKEGHRSYTVYVEGKDKVTCTCGLYEHAGLPCRHSLKIMVHLDINKIPPGNVHWRWTRAYSEDTSEQSATLVTSNSLNNPGALQRNMLAMKALELSQTNEGLDDQDYAIALQAIDKVISKIQNKSQGKENIPTILKHAPISCPPRTKRTCRPRGTSLKRWNNLTKLEKEKVRQREDAENNAAASNSNKTETKTRKLSDLLQVT